MSVKKQIDAMDVIRRARFETDEINVAFSCGKDSAVLLDLCYKWFKKIAAFHMYVVPGISFHQQYIKFAEKRFAKKLVCPVIQIPHWCTSKLFRAAALRPDNLPSENVPQIRVRDIEVAVRKKSGIAWFAWGQKKNDSLERRAMLNKCSGVDIGSSRCYPLTEWTDRTVIEYLKEKKIPLSADYGWPDAAGRSYGGHLEGEYLKLVKDNSPADYERIKEVFPFVEAEVFRFESGMKGGPKTRKQA